ncbi:MAG: histidine kinase [Chitinophagaceae bacterium]|nr:MAG: histidine kinase [Chitinophagaceae bacterium]
MPKMVRLIWEKRKLPIKKMFSLDLLLAAIVSCIVYLALSTARNGHHAMVFSLMGMVSITMIGAINILALVWIKGKNPQLGSPRAKLLRFAYTYPTSIAIYLLIFPIFASFSDGSKWSYADPQTLLVFVISGCMVNTVIIMLNDLIRLQYEQMDAELELSKIKNAHAEATILLLRQQIQPHFLFNALNTLKSLYKLDANTGDSYMVHLANFLRASIFGRDKAVASLQEELQVLEDYLQMQKIRFGKALECIIDTSGTVGGNFFLPAFSLQPLLENALKHNELTEELPLQVEIKVTSDRVWVSNNVRAKKVAYSTGSGLANLTERCKLLSGEEIIIHCGSGGFSVGIKLMTDEHSNHRG